MTTDELDQLFTSHGHECRVRKDQVEVRVCWYCGNPKWNLHADPARGLIWCWNCKQPNPGVLSRVLREMFGMDVDIQVDRGRTKLPPPDRSGLVGELGLLPVESVPSARAYLLRRGLDPQDYREYEAGVCSVKDHQLFARLIFPVREFWSGRPVGVVARRYMGQEGPKYMNDAERRIVGYRNHDRSAPYVLCEGIFDGIKLHKAGANASVLLGVDHPDVEEWAELVPEDAKVGVCLDGEARDAARKLLSRILPIRPARLLELPDGLDPGVLDPKVLSLLLRSRL